MASLQIRSIIRKIETISIDYVKAKHACTCETLNTQQTENTEHVHTHIYFYIHILIATLTAGTFSPQLETLKTVKR